MSKVYLEVTDENRPAVCDWARSEGVDPFMVSTAVDPYFIRGETGALRFVYAEPLVHDGKTYPCAYGDDHVASMLVSVSVSVSPPWVSVPRAGTPECQGGDHSTCSARLFCNNRLH